MNAYDTLPESVTEVFGEEATAERAYDLLTVDVPVGSWIPALETARDKLGCTYFDWLSAVDEPGVGFRVCAHVVALEAGVVRRLLVRTTVPHAAPSLPTAVEIYAGAAWHERETHEMFGVEFTGHPHLVPLLLPENFEGHPLRKDFVLAARVVKAWPGAKEPGESEHGGPKRRQMLPPGVPDPNDWGPLKGQLPPAPTRPARATAGERPPRRARTTAEGSATQTPETPTAPRRARTTADGSTSQTPAPEPTTDTATPTPPTGPRRSRSVSEGSSTQRAEEPITPEAEAGAPEGPAGAPRRSRSAADGSVSQTTPGVPAEPDTPAAPPAGTRRSRRAADGSVSQTTPGAPAEPEQPEPPASEASVPEGPARAPRRSRSVADGSASQAPAAPAPPARTRSADAPWHHARPAFDEEAAEAEPAPEAEAEADGTDARTRTDNPPTPTDPAGGESA
ncbi:NADH-quinone oxidoreductase subunit C [Streptomyces vilmorinianum]|uniref:NADH-quinone oxidoreductase subunit C n=1 Tax=Streptomyces vilmorinianum TaxID=3051092 RepID=UPI0010FB4363|nr:NADH-quinone oxidoreductase subunit C [Streptomyces vilmorinianum]